MKQLIFIPCTIARSIGDGIFFRPIKSWHSGTYAGEHLLKIPGTIDGSGCVRSEAERTCSIPLTVTHRLYWHEHYPTAKVSAFLSYPDAMGCSNGEYFWETYGISGDVERYFGDNAEAEMEEAVKKFFNKAAEGETSGHV